MAKSNPKTNVDVIPTFRTPYNHKAIGIIKMVSKQPSKTVPDMSMTIKQILEQRTKGIAPALGKIPIYQGGDEFIPEIQKLDLVDRQELYHRARVQIEEMKELYEQIKTDKERVERETQEQKEQAEKEKRKKEFEDFILKRNTEKS